MTTAKITLNLKEAGPIGAVVIGYNVKNKWDIKVPAEVKVTGNARACSCHAVSRFMKMLSRPGSR